MITLNRSSYVLDIDLSNSTANDYVQQTNSVTISSSASLPLV